jgi:hypothetical protein
MILNLLLNPASLAFCTVFSCTKLDPHLAFVYMLFVGLLANCTTHISLSFPTISHKCILSRVIILLYITYYKHKNLVRNHLAYRISSKLDKMLIFSVSILLNINVPHSIASETLKFW